MNYTEEDIRQAFKAGNDAQYENELYITLKEEEDNFVKELTQVKKLTITDVMHPLKTFDIHNCINDIAKVAQHRSYSVYELSKDQVFRYGCKVAIDKMLYKK